MTVLNEEKHLAAAVQRVLQQGYDGDLEVVVAVGPSKDKTWERAQELVAADSRVVVVENPTGRTPAGLNIAISHAKHEIIMRVDGHVELSEDYLATAVATLADTGAANVGGVMDASGITPFQQAVAAAYNSPLGLGGGGFHHLSTPEGPADTVFLGTFRRDALEEVGGYDETLHRAQDWELNLRLRKAGHVVWFTPKLRVTYRPRASVSALAKQFFRTGQWRREVMRRHPETASPRYLAPPAAVLGMALGGATGAVGVITGRKRLLLGWLNPLAYLGFLTVATATIEAPNVRARCWLPLVLAVMHICWGTGFLVGLR